MKVTVHTLLISAVDEVYAQVPCTTKDTLDLPTLCKLRQSEGESSVPGGIEP
jgi:hypothetical protein